MRQPLIQLFYVIRGNGEISLGVCLSDDLREFLENTAYTAEPRWQIEGPGDPVSARQPNP